MSNHPEHRLAVHKHQHLHNDDHYDEKASRQYSSRKIANNGGHGGATAADDNDAKNQRYRQDYRSHNDRKEKSVDNSQDLRPQQQLSFRVPTISNQTHRIDTATSRGQKRGATYENERRFDSIFHRSANEFDGMHSSQKNSKIEARDYAKQIDSSRPTEDKGSNRLHFSTEYTRTNTTFFEGETATAQQPHPSSSSTLLPPSHRMAVDVNTSDTVIGDGGNHSSSNNGDASTTAQSNKEHIASLKNMFINMNANGIENVANKIASNQLHAIPMQSVHLYGSDKLYVNYCWSLISRLDVKLCFKYFKLKNSEDMKYLDELVSQIMASLSNLHNFLKRVNIDRKFKLNENVVKKYVFEDGESQNVQFDKVAPSENEWIKHMMMLIREFDYNLCILCKLMVSDDKVLEDLENDIFCSINNILHDQHLDYLESKVFQNISELQHGNDRGIAAAETAANTVKLRGLFFVSLRKDISMKWIDMNYQLREVLKKYMHKEFDAKMTQVCAQMAKKTTEIHVNISMSKNAKHFCILSKRTPTNRFMSTFTGNNDDGDGLLALVQLDSMNLDYTKNTITFKALVLNTISANDFKYKQ
ncbi:uncharacterized protein LOC116841216 isoform X2 [Odontomachus brunneus]|nr:uncharacterized protein LOC116841216 isoform X2 [Odontomachus brunneus]